MALPKQAVQATENANECWKRLALATIKRMARQKEVFTSYDVVQKLNESDIKTHDLRAIGGVFVKARNQGLIESVGMVRRNDFTRAVTTVWRSRCLRKK